MPCKFELPVLVVSNQLIMTYLNDLTKMYLYTLQKLFIYKFCVLIMALLLIKLKDHHLNLLLHY